MFKLLKRMFSWLAATDFAFWLATTFFPSRFKGWTLLPRDDPRSLTKSLIHIKTEEDKSHQQTTIFTDRSKWTWCVVVHLQGSTSARIMVEFESGRTMTRAEAFYPGMLAIVPIGPESVYIYFASEGTTPPIFESLGEMPIAEARAKFPYARLL